MGTSVYYNPTTHELTCLVHSKNEIFFNKNTSFSFHCWTILSSTKSINHILSTITTTLTFASQIHPSYSCIHQKKHNHILSTTISTICRTTSTFTSPNPFIPPKSNQIPMHPQIFISNNGIQPSHPSNSIKV